ncbi:hypothetical protein [Pseudomonas sp. KU43P]|uniref:hypothetical protein n=1 Tax=Pseudomonas sp. KU43P TaxID=2487887 RepID=UPI0012A9F6F5|nr:hypothetical protein [Pseudomonas sp. KU43P]BBH46840.1 hypothetical protein KU43P_33170 [Pseudomonas sp. KU43P]
MSHGPYKDEVSALGLLNDRSQAISASHDQIASDIQLIREQLLTLAGGLDMPAEEITPGAAAEVGEQQSIDVPIADIYAQARMRHPDARLSDVLNDDDYSTIDQRLNAQLQAFNARYNLDGWDYAIAGCSGLFSGVLDLLFVRGPAKPGTKWNTPVDGTFNSWVQQLLNTWLPPELSKKLGDACKIGAPDSSVWTDLIGAPDKVLNPINHRLRSLAHDPILGFFYGVYDMIHGTCTVVVNGQVMQLPSKKGPTEGNLFQLLGKMFGHLLSDLNAPSAKGNRGMGLPAPFMGLLRMFENLEIDGVSFGKQIEWMYTQGYDFRQFLVTSVPAVIMEVIMRVFYVVKQVAINGATFSQAFIETLPGQMSPRFRIMLAIAYGASSAVNAGKMYVSRNLLDLNYAAWMGLVWNGSFALKWSLYDRHVQFWEEVELYELKHIGQHIEKLDDLLERSRML